MNAHAIMEQEKQADYILANDVNQAVRQLISLSKDLIKLADDEAQALVTLDHMKFALAQSDKEKIAERYAKASEEFRNRLGAFRLADKSMIAQLNALQNELKEKTEHNNVMIDQIKKRTSANTQATLFTAQQMGQRVNFEYHGGKEV